jgi:hypothetical protein
VKTPVVIDQSMQNTNDHLENRREYTVRLRGVVTRTHSGSVSKQSTARAATGNSLCNCFWQKLCLIHKSRGEMSVN